MTVSTFELFRIGVGPSSSHTVGPMRAGLEFARSLRERLTTTSADDIPSTADSGLADDEYVELVGGAVTQDPESITVILYGSLAATGAGHGTLGACLLGLDGADPATVDPDFMGPRLEEIRRTRTINLAGDESLQVQCGFEDIVLRPTVARTIHTNAVTFSAIVRGQRYKQTFYSIGGGFIRTKEEVPDQDALTGPWLFTSSKELVAKAEELGGSVAEVQRKCEQSRRSDPQIMTSTPSWRQCLTALNAELPRRAFCLVAWACGVVLGSGIAILSSTIPIRRPSFPPIG